MRHPLFLLIAALLVVPAEAQTFTDRSDLLDEQNKNKHFSWSVSIADMDGNGLPDIHEPGILYLQQEDGSFVSSLPDLGITYERLPEPLIGYEGRGIFGAVMADLNDDGFSEFVILDITPDSSTVYTNHFGLSLEKVSPENGVRFKGLGQGAAFADFNGDGPLDLFFGEEHGHNQLFLGNGRGGFSESTLAAGIHKDVHTYGVATADYDNDGDMDVFIAACAQDPDHSINALFRNNGNGTFEEVGVAAGIADDGNAWGVNFFDYDRDGWLDIHLANMTYPALDARGNKNKLYRNLGDGTFEDVSIQAGIEGNDESYGSSVADFNNDGWLDIWVANFASAASVLINNGDGTFTDVYPTTGLSSVFYHLSVAVADFNADGWVDVYTGSDSDDGIFSRLLFNDPGSNHWLLLKVTQEAPNRSGIGSRVSVWTDGMLQIRDITAGDGFVSQNMGMTAHFGLGASAKADSIIVRWPDGHVDRWSDIAADQQLTLAKGGGFNEPPLPFRAESIVTKAAGKRLTGKVSWEATSDPEGMAISYQVAVRDAGGQVVHVSDPLTTTDYTFEVDTTGVDASAPWSFVVTASDDLHIRRSVNVGNVLLEGTQVARSPTPEALSLESLWPQPSSGRVNINVKHDGNADGLWAMFDLQGRRVRSGSLSLQAGHQTISIDAEGLPGGLYLLRMTAGSTVVSRPVMMVGHR